MKTCGKCTKHTNSNYSVRQYGILCGDCAKEHGDNKIEQLNKAINEIRENIGFINNDIKEAIYSDCKHKFEDTGYCHITNGNVKTIYCCSACGLEKLGEMTGFIEM